MPDDLKPLMVELKPSNIDRTGVGVFALWRISKGQTVGEGISDDPYETLIPWEAIEQLERNQQERIISLAVGTSKGFMRPPNSDFNSLPFVFYINHSCEGSRGYNLAGAFIALRDIEAGEELTSDYGLVESNPNFAMNCTCGVAPAARLLRATIGKMKHVGRHISNMLPELRVAS